MAERPTDHRDEGAQGDEAASPAAGDAPPGREFELSRSFQFGTQLPLNTLPPETIERLRAGGEISPEELAIIQSAALRDAGPLGKLVQALLSSQPSVAASTDDSLSGTAPGVPAAADGNFVAVPGSARTFEWRWERKAGQETADFQPATYYEALTGKRDPQRDFFIKSRRIINAIVWVIALGLPIALTALMILTGQDLQTIVLVGFAGFVVGMMFRSSFPRTPFD